MRVSSLAFCLLALTAATSLGVRAEAESSIATVVGVDKVLTEPLSQTTPVIGRLVALQSGVVSVRINGAVAEVFVQVGDRVKKGEVLAVIVDNRLSSQRDLLAAEVEESAAQVVRAEAELALASQEFARLEGLLDSAAFSQGRYDDSRQNVARARGLLGEAEARLDRARANLKIAEIDLSNAEIRAPYAGVVVMRHTAPGAYLNVGQEVITLVNDADLEIEADVPADRIAGLSPGVVVEFAFSKDTRHQAVVRAIVPEENPLTRTLLVRFTPVFVSDVGFLAINQSLVLDIPIGASRQVVTVHKDAIVHRDGKPYVFLVSEEGTADPRELVLGDALEGRFEVVTGLEPGDLVVVRGNERLIPYQAIEFEP